MKVYKNFMGDGSKIHANEIVFKDKNNNTHFLGEFLNDVVFEQKIEGSENSVTIDNLNLKNGESYDFIFIIYSHNSNHDSDFKIRFNNISEANYFSVMKFSQGTRGDSGDIESNVQYRSGTNCIGDWWGNAKHTNIPVIFKGNVRIHEGILLYEINYSSVMSNQQRSVHHEGLVNANIDNLTSIKFYQNNSSVNNININSYFLVKKGHI